MSAAKELKLLKNSLSILQNDFKSFISTGEAKRTKNLVNGRLSIMEDVFRQGKNTGDKLVMLLEDDEDISLFEGILGEIRKVYLEYRTELLDCLDKLAESTSGNKPTPSSSNTHGIRLPEMSLPVFSGQYEKWRPFKSKFESMIHNNADLTEIQKLHYLKSGLSKDADSLLQHLEVEEGNYDKAWSLLCSRYDNKRFLVNTHLKMFINQSSISNESSFSLRKLLDTSTECLHSLKNLDVPIEHWDIIIIYILLHKLPSCTQQLWEERLGAKKELPKFSEFSEFLETRFRTLEVVDQDKPKSGKGFTGGSSQRQYAPKNVYHLQQKPKDKYNCKVCSKGQHSLRKCNYFGKMNPVERCNIVDKIGVCSNCLAYSHATQYCPSQARCYYCQQKHHSLLHSAPIQNNPSSHCAQISQPQTHINPTLNTNSTQFNPTQNTNTNMQRIPPNPSAFQQSGTSISSVGPNTQGSQPSTSDHPTTSTSYVNTYYAHQGTNSQVLLATAVVKVMSARGKYFNLRALIDPGSEATFITEAAVQMLNLRTRSTLVEVSGLGKVSSGACRKCVDITFASLRTTFEANTQAFVFKSLTGLLPAKQLTLSNWKHLSGLELADPVFYKPATVDLLLGSDVFADFVLPDIVRGEDSMSPIAQRTELGWILLGKVPIDTPKVSKHCFLQCFNIDTQLRKFWEMEEAPYAEAESEDDIACEKHYEETTRRLSDGRYEVSLPFKDGCKPGLGPSKHEALRRFHQLEKRFEKNPTLYKEYCQCLKEYLELGQMSEVDVLNDAILGTPYHYFVPHHAVLKESSTTTKLRVVFDAAAKTLDGTSLNSHLLIGPKTQNNINDIVLAWRTHQFTFTADIEKMFRQIRMRKDDSYYQLILWRDNPTQPIRTYRMQTVTFGTASAPYLANRTIQRLAVDEEHRYPIGANVVRNGMYVDDLIAGADTLDEARIIRDQARHLLASAGFNLRKWTSNNDMLLNEIPIEQRELGFSLPFEAGSAPQIKTLGIRWFPIGDYFSFQNVFVDTAKTPTKRTMLSTIARLFDPLGWIAPCIILAKILMQQLWCRGLAWDDPIPAELKDHWDDFRRELPSIENIQIPRWIHLGNKSRDMELHGFCDASEKAYGALVYLRVLDDDGNIHVHLLMSKTRVAPLKTVTLPRLELCGAVILATLLDYIARILKLDNVRKYAWTDSKITLAWIMAHPARWKTFVNNRVAEIQRLTNCSIWRYIPTHQNPADLASRGLLPPDLNGNKLWWNGPEFLSSEWMFETPSQPPIGTTDEEKRNIQTHCVSTESNDINLLIHRHSNLRKLLRILAYCRRFISNMRTADKKLMLLSPMEMDLALKATIKIVQKSMFFTNDDNQPNLKGLKSLQPFLDEAGILRVGGRLQNADLSYEQRHPIILKSSHHFSRLIIRDAHSTTYHGGTQQMIAQLRQRFWILNIKNSVKKCIHDCNVCFRQRAKPISQLMGNLPAPRVRISRPFSYTGVDYAGPIDVKAWKGRGSKMFKAYFAIFVCLSTKAVHLELVSDMTTQAFIAAYRRFSSRRGVCKEIFSDCGTNFVGAAKELENLRKAANYNEKQVAETLLADNTKWNFIPPASPHFGGLWEAGVKSVKYHLKRVAGNTSLTFEELSTLLIQIEGCLNSRPLCPLTSNPDDFTALTPAHFLIGEPIRSVPEPDTTEEKICYNDRWKRIQQLYQHFWKQWSSEYLSRLQQRPKWLKTEENPQLGDLVLMKDERIPPSKWIMARIIQLHPGTDGLIRVVTLKTQNGELKRPITKICPLPSNKITADQSLV